VLSGTRGSVKPADVDKQLPPEDLAKRKALNDQVKVLDKQRPAPLPMAEIITDGDWRFAPNGRGRRDDRLPEVPDPARGQSERIVPAARGRVYKPPASYFLIKGDPQSHGFSAEAGVHRGGHLRQSADGNSAAERAHVGPPAGAGGVESARRRIRWPRA